MFVRIEQYNETGIYSFFVVVRLYFIERNRQQYSFLYLRIEGFIHKKRSPEASAETNRFKK